MDQPRQRAAQRLQFGDAGVDAREVIGGEAFHILAGAALVVIERQEGAAILDAEPEAPRAVEKGQPVNVAVGKDPVAVGIAAKGDKADFLVIADRLDGQAAGLRGVGNAGHAVSSRVGRSARRRSALDSTKIDDSAMAPAARGGDNSVPKAG